MRRSNRENTDRHQDRTFLTPCPAILVLRTIIIGYRVGQDRKRCPVLFSGKQSFFVSNRHLVTLSAFSTINNRQLYLIFCLGIILNSLPHVFECRYILNEFSSQSNDIFFVYSLEKLSLVTCQCIMCARF